MKLHRPYSHHFKTCHLLTLSAIVTLDSRLTLLTLCDEITKVAISHMPPWRPPSSACELSLLRSSMLVALSNLKPSMTKVSPSSSMLAWHSCWICHNNNNNMHTGPCSAQYAWAHKIITRSFIHPSLLTTPLYSRENDVYEHGFMCLLVCICLCVCMLPERKRNYPF